MSDTSMVCVPLNGLTVEEARAVVHPSAPMCNWEWPVGAARHGSPFLTTLRLNLGPFGRVTRGLVVVAPAAGSTGVSVLTCVTFNVGGVARTSAVRQP